MKNWLTDAMGETPLPYFVRSFAKPATGSSNDDDEDDSDDDEDDEEDDDEEEDDDLANMSTEDLVAALKETKAQLSKSGGANKLKRDRIKKLNRELADSRQSKPKGKSKDDDDSDKLDADAIREEAKAEANKRADERIKRSEAKAALLGRGATRETAPDLVGFIKLDNLDIDEDGNVDEESLEEEIDRITKKYPSFFTKTRRKRESISGDGDRGGDKARRKPMTTDERQAALVTGGRRS